MIISDIVIAIIGGDKRQLHIYESLKRIYKNAVFLGYENNKYSPELVKTAEIIVFPTVASRDGIKISALEYNGEILFDELINNAEKCRIIISGIIHPKIKKEAEKRNIICIEYTKNEAFKTYNAIPTAEGAIALAITNSEITLWNSKCLIIGNGAIGKRLSDNLKALGADVTVSARKPNDFAQIDASGKKHIETMQIENGLYNYNFIFNTVPFAVINDKALKTLPNTALIIDLASYPYGLDHKKADDYKCKIVLGSSLPGKYSPISAAEITSAEIVNIINEVQNNE